MFTNIEYENIEDEDKVFSPDGTKAVYWYVSRHRQDRWDDDYDYEIIVWDVATRQKIQTIYKSAELALSTGYRNGEEIADVKFSDDSQSLIFEYYGGTTSLEKISPS